MNQLTGSPEEPGIGTDAEGNPAPPGVDLTPHHSKFCQCGVLVPPFTPAEDDHFVFAVRADGTRSNLGFCPEVRGMDEAIARARTCLETGRAMYRGEVV